MTKGHTMMITFGLTVEGDEYVVEMTEGSMYVTTDTEEVEFDCTMQETLKDVRNLISGWREAQAENAWENFLSDYYSR